MSKTLKQVITASIIVCALGGGYGYAYYLLQKESAHAAELTRSVSLEAKREEELRLMRASLQEVEEERAILDGYLLPEDGLIDLLGTFESLGSQYGAGIEVVSVSEVMVSPPHGLARGSAESATHPALKLAIVIRGSWSNVLHVAALLESFPLPIRVEGLSFEKVGGGDEGAWEAQLEITVARDV